MAFPLVLRATDALSALEEPSLEFLDLRAGSFGLVEWRGVEEAEGGRCKTCGLWIHLLCSLCFASRLESRYLDSAGVEVP